jgi:hypothetical protein
VDPVPEPQLLRKSGRVGNRIRNLWICSQRLWPLGHRGGPLLIYIYNICCSVKRSEPEVHKIVKNILLKLKVIIILHVIEKSAIEDLKK